jgi:hypothetical protein
MTFAKFSGKKKVTHVRKLRKVLLNPHTGALGQVENDTHAAAQV